MTTLYLSASTDLLEQLANSVYDRDPNTSSPLFFSMKEVEVVQQWLIEFLKYENKGVTKDG